MKKIYEIWNFEKLNASFTKCYTYYTYKEDKLQWKSKVSHDLVYISFVLVSL